MNNAWIYREAALRKSGQVQPRGEMPVFHSPAFHFFFWLLGLSIFLMCVWGVAGTVNDTVSGGGLILHGGEYGSVSARGSGILLSIDVARGDEVHAGQVVGRVFSNDDLEEFFQLTRMLRHEESVFAMIAERVESLKKEKRDLTDEDIRLLDGCLERAKKQAAWYDDFIVKNVSKLEKSGAISQLQAASLRDTHNERLADREKLESSRLQEKVSLANTVFDLDDTLVKYELDVKRARFGAEQKMRNIRYRSRVICTCDGTVANLNVRPGDMVSPGTRILRVALRTAPDERAWTVNGYVPLAEAAKVKPGMRVLVTPTTVRAEREGSIIGVVTAVGDAPETMESLNHRYQDQSFTDFIFAGSKKMPVEVSILLSCNRANPSGFNWTSGKGPDLVIGANTMCAVRVTTGDYSPLEILFAKVRRIVAGQGVLEEAR